jgi:hypothetical protein
VRALSQRRPREGGDPYAVPPMLRMMSNSLLHGRVASMNAWGYGSPPSRGRRSENPHCEPTGRASARPMTGSATQSMRQQKARVECVAELAMTAYVQPQLRILAAHFARVLFKVPPSSYRGSRECRTLDASAASRVEKNTRVSHHGHAGTPGIPRAMVLTASFALSRVTGLCCHPRRRNRFHRLDASVGASGPHDFAVRCQHRPSSAQPRPPHPARRP